MNRIIEEQLKKTRLADLTNYNPATRVYSIPRYSKPVYDIGKCYLVKLPNHLVNDHTSVLSCNWNNATSPKHPYLKIYVSKAMGNMIYVDSIAYDFEARKDIYDTWSGWLVTEELSQIAKI